MKDSFIIFTESWELVSLLSQQQKGILLEALFRYTADEELPEMDNITMVVFTSMRQKIDYANKRYEEIRDKRRENGKLGGRPKKPNGFSENQMVSEKSKNNQMVFSESKKSLTDTDTVTDTVTVSKEKYKEKEPPQAKCPLFEHEEVVTAWREWVEMRRKTKKPITTERTRTMAINKLMELSKGDAEEAVKVLNQSTDHCWVGLFAVKDEWQRPKLQPTAYAPKDSRKIDYDAVIRDMYVNDLKGG